VRCSCRSSIRRETQVDFGEGAVEIAGAERKAHYFVMDLPQFDDCS
jgi:hypothetical protein